MGTQFLGYGGHALNEGLGLDASGTQPTYRLATECLPIDGIWGVYVRLSSPLCQGRVLDWI